MKEIREIKEVFQNIQEYIKQGTYEKINSLLTQLQYVKLFQNIYQLDGDQVKNIVDDFMKEIIIKTQEQFKQMLKNNLNDETLLKTFNQIFRDQLIQIYWISILFNQFNQFIFMGFQNMSLEQYCLKPILQNYFGKYSKKVTQVIIDALWTRKSSQDFKKRFDYDLLKIINFFSYRKFLNYLTIEKCTSDFQMDVIFSCDFTEDEVVELNRQQEIQKQYDLMKILDSDEDEKINQNSDQEAEKEESQKEKGEKKSNNKVKNQPKIKRISKRKNKKTCKKSKNNKFDNYDNNEEDIIEEEIKNQYSQESSMEIELNQDIKQQKKKNSNKELESLYSLIEDMYMERLIKNVMELLEKIKNNKVYQQIEEIEEFIFREQQFVSFYLNMFSIKISDKLFNLCVLENYQNLVNHPQYGLPYLFEQKNICQLQGLYNFVQNDQKSIEKLAFSFSLLIENKIQDIEKQQDKLFQKYSQTKLIDNSKDYQENQQYKDIQFIEECQDKWIQQMYDLYQDMHKEGLEKSFDNNPILHAALNKGFQHQFHLSEVAVEYLVNTCNLLLLKPKYRNSDNISYKDPQQRLFAIKKLFSFVSSKDLFLEIYRKKLSRRLIYSLSVSQQIEEQFLNALESIVGLNQQIKQMKSMIGDLKKNQLLQSDYQSNSQPDQKQEDINNFVKEEITLGKKQNSSKKQISSRSRSNSNERKRTSLATSEDWKEQFNIDYEEFYVSKLNQ